MSKVKVVFGSPIFCDNFSSIEYGKATRPSVQRGTVLDFLLPLVGQVATLAVEKRLELSHLAFAVFCRPFTIKNSGTMLHGVP